MGQGPGLSLVVELQCAGRDGFLKVGIDQTGDGLLQIRQLQIMGADEAEAVSLRQRGDVGTAADEPLSIVGAFEDLVDQEQHGWYGAFLGGIENRLQSFHFSVEERQTGIERIVDANAAGQAAPGPCK